ncbi:MAG: alanine racemase C-terminal domain-containing protein, partial [bacterium]
LLTCGPSPFDLTRPGLALYGHRPAEWLPDRVPLEPVLSVHARLALVKEAVDDALVGYSQTPVPKGTRVGILPVGYGDGIPQRLGYEGGYVLFTSGRAPLIGVVSMDSCAVDLSGLPDVDTGHEALLLGRGPAGEIPPEEVAGRTGRSTYELLVGLSRRLPRIFR